MANTYKVLGQSNPSADTLTALYAVPSSTQAIVNTIVVCNRAATSTDFRISIQVNGAADDSSQYLYYDTPIQGNDTFIANLGMTLGDTDEINVYADDANLTFTAFGVEIA